MKRSSLFGIGFAFALLFCLFLLPVADARAGGCAVQQAAVVAPVYAAPIVAQVIAQPVYQQAIVQQVVAQPVYEAAYVRGSIKAVYDVDTSGVQQQIIRQRVVASPIRQRVVVQRVRSPVVTRTRTVQRVVTR